MKILAIGSSRKNGNTEQIITLMEQQLKQRAALEGIALEVEYLPLREYTITACRGCRACFNAGEERCPLKDGLLAVEQKLQSADGLILGSPVYVEDVNGALKSLIDRLAFHCHRPAFFGKAAVTFTTSGVGASRHALATMQRALGTWGFYLCGEARFRMGARMESSEAVQVHGKKAAALADRLYETVLKNKAARPSFYQLVFFTVQQSYYRKPPRYGNEYDHAYWKRCGWLEQGSNYYIKHRANPVKTAFARLAGQIVAQFFV